MPFGFEEQVRIRISEAGKGVLTGDGPLLKYIMYYRCGAAKQNITQL